MGTDRVFVKIGRAVRYREASLRKYIQEQTRTSTNNGE